VRALAERELENTQLREKVATAQKVEADLRAELATSEARNRASTESLRGEKSQVEGQLSQTKEAHAAAQSEIAAIKREAEQTWASERVENALLRERINDIAVEIARLTVALEGKASPIEALLAGEPEMPEPHSGNGNGEGAQPGQGRGSLADRIRALQNKASRLQPSN
jgi:hypothetical protein